MAGDYRASLNSFLESLRGHPGFLGFTSRGVILIHADWPAYPAEHGWGVALASFGQFPRGTHFRGVDDIDQCFLFRVEHGGHASKPFHVAAWHEDVLDLHRRGYVLGAKETTLQEWCARRAKELEALFCFGPNGERLPVPPPSVDDFRDEDEAIALMIADSGLTVSSTGWAFLENALSACRDQLHDRLAKRVDSLLDHGPYDTAVREGCVVLESRIRELTAGNKYGTALVSEFLSQLAASGRVIPAQLKVLEAELRATFQFVRNDFMHNVRELTREQALAFLARLSSLLHQMDAVESLRRPGADRDAT